MKFYVWFTLTDPKGLYPRISNEADFLKLPKDAIRPATEDEAKNIIATWVK